MVSGMEEPLERGKLVDMREEANRMAREPNRQEMLQRVLDVP